MSHLSIKQIYNTSLSMKRLNGWKNINCSLTYWRSQCLYNQVCQTLQTRLYSENPFEVSIHINSEMNWTANSISQKFSHYLGNILCWRWALPLNSSLNIFWKTSRDFRPLCGGHAIQMAAFSDLQALFGSMENTFFLPFHTAFALFDQMHINGTNYSRKLFPSEMRDGHWARNP